MPGGSRIAVSADLPEREAQKFFLGTFPSTRPARPGRDRHLGAERQRGGPGRGRREEPGRGGGGPELRCRDGSVRGGESAARGAVVCRGGWCRRARTRHGASDQVEPEASGGLD